MPKSCQCGCGSPVVSPDKWGREVRFIKGHAHRPRNTERYRVDSDTGCWLWLLATNKDGYATETYDGSRTLAHIVSYEKHIGPVPEGHELHHRCETKRCINPWHLEPVTRVEHKRQHSKLDVHKVCEIRRRRLEQGTSFRQLGRDFGVTEGSIRFIVKGNHWRDVECHKEAA